MKFYPYEKGGGGESRKSFSHAEGGGGGHKQSGVQWPQSTLFSLLRTHFSVLLTPFSVLLTLFLFSAAPFFSSPHLCSFCALSLSPRECSE